MPTISTCPMCKGEIYYKVLTNAHSNEKETIKCTNCNNGVIYQMTDEEEDDYHANYW